MSVKILKLVSGQEIICRVTDVGDGQNFHVEHPLAIQPRMTEDGFALALIPFSFGGIADKVTIPNKDVLCSLNPEPDLATQYSSSISGLILPRSQTNKVVLTEG